MKQERDAISRLEEAVKQLRTSYEKYFAGIDRIPPLKDREGVKRDLRRLIGSGTHNTALRFRIHSLQSTLVTYESYWDRITRRIEEGTYHRDQLRMQRRASAAPSPEEPAAEPVADTVPSAAPAEAYPESLQRLHDALNDARRRAGDERPVSIEALATTVRKQMAMIKQRTQCKRVEFKVTVRDGKAILKAIPK